MADTTFSVGDYSCMRFRLEPTSISGCGTATSPALSLLFSTQLSPIPAQPAPIHYALIRLAGRLSTGSQAEQVATFEAPPLAETSNPGNYERHLIVEVPLSIREVKRIEEIRDGKDPRFRISLTGLVVVPHKGFQRLTDSVIDLTVPRSHWIDHVLNVWKISDLCLLEVRLPSAVRSEFSVVQERLTNAEQQYRLGHYPNVLSNLRLAFEAVAEVYGANRADKNLFDKMLASTHPEIREKLRDSFDYIYRLLNAGPHEPTPTAQQPIPIGREEARFALIASAGVFEYFSRYNWPGI